MSNDTGPATGGLSGSGLIPPIQPISFLTTILLFAVPSAIFSFSYLVLLPALTRRGFSLFAVFNLTFVSPLALLLIAAFTGLRLEGRHFTWPAIRDRLRLGRMPGYGWLWVVGVFAFVILAAVAMDYVFPTSPTSLRLFTWPKEFADLFAALHNVDKDFLGIPLRGHWWVFVYFMFVLIIFNVFGEELWWRGYILPRQELAQGRWAWVIHGVLWNLFHIFYHQTVWSFVALLPVTLSIAFVCQKVRNTWPGIVIHTLANSDVPVAILLGILGRK